MLSYEIKLLAGAALVRSPSDGLDIKWLPILLFLASPHSLDYEARLVRHGAKATQQHSIKQRAKPGMSLPIEIPRAQIV